jgi:hypothetical protein
MGEPFDGHDPRWTAIKQRLTGSKLASLAVRLGGMMDELQVQPFRRFPLIFFFYSLYYDAL